MSELQSAEPKVSILVPCYNVERYLEQCLGSLKAQTLQDIEVICINDGSTDSTAAIIDRFCAEDARFRVIEKENSGYGASMNRGLDAARGTYVGILESDDFCELETFERLHAAAERTAADAVKANFFFYWSTEEPHNRKNELIGAQTPEVVEPASYPELFWYMPSIWSALYRRDFLQENGIRFLETPGASYQDLSFTFKVWACASKVALLSDAFVHYRQDNEASSIHAPGKVFCVCDEFDEIERFLDAHPDKDALRTVETRLKFDSYIWNYWRLDVDLRAQFIERFEADFKAAEAAGTIDFDLFQPWSEADLRHILKSASDFHAWATITQGKQTGVASLVRYWEMGGLGLVMKRLKYRG